MKELYITGCHIDFYKFLADISPEIYFPNMKKYNIKYKDHNTIIRRDSFDINSKLDFQ